MSQVPNGWSGSELSGTTLPESMTRIVRSVTAGRGLWSRERSDVTEELTAHFLDGLDAGLSPEELVRDFGDAELVARLVRMAKRRTRPMLWQAGRLALFSTVLPLGVVVGLYVLSAARLHLAQPLAATVRHDTVQQVAIAHQTTWLLYKAAAEHLPAGSIESGLRLPDPWQSDDAAMPTGHSLDDESRQLVLQASRLQSLEFAQDIVDPGLDPTMRAAYVRRQWQAKGPELATMIALARGLCVDASEAADRRDLVRVRENFEASLSMARQIRGLKLPVADYAAAVIENDTARTLIGLETAPPSVTTNPEWLTIRGLLEHRARLDGVRRAFGELVHWMYSDEGWTGGGLTAEGIELVGILKEWHEPDVFERLARPAWYFNPARSESVLNRVEQLVRQVEDSTVGDTVAVAALRDELQQTYVSRWQCFHNPALSVVLPDLARIFQVELSAREARVQAAQRIRG